MKAFWFFILVMAGSLGLALAEFGNTGSYGSIGNNGGGGATNGIQVVGGAGTNNTLMTPTLINPTLTGGFVNTLIGNGAGLTNLPNTFTNTANLWVDKAGTTGVRGFQGRPYPTPTSAAAAAQAGDTIRLVGPNTSSTSLATTNISWVGYGAVLTNALPGGSTEPDFVLSLKQAKVYGLTITNTATDLTVSSGFGLENNSPATQLDVRDAIVTGDGYGAFLYTSNAVSTRWYNCHFQANYQAFNAGSCNNTFWGCWFDASTPSLFSLQFNGAYVNYAFAADGYHGPDVAATNTFYGCIFTCKNIMGASNALGASTGLEVEFHSWNQLNNCVIDVADTHRNIDTAKAVNFIEDHEHVELNNCTVYWGGATNINLVCDENSGGPGPYVLYLNNTFAYPTTNGVSVDNGPNLVYVSGGNFIPANFSNPANVIWLPTPTVFTNANNLLVGSNVFTGTLDLSGELRTTNNAGTVGQVMTSAGNGKPPFWGGAASSGTIYVTNLVDSLWYTNSYSTPITVRGTITLYMQSGANTTEYLVLRNGANYFWTNILWFASPGAAGTFEQGHELTADVPAGYNYCFTNIDFSAGLNVSLLYTNGVEIYVH